MVSEITGCLLLIVYLYILCVYLYSSSTQNMDASSSRLAS
jgi:hypothetical protein